ncbi:putative Ubiquitin carboxyl-terminal hydrolase 11 [Glarea lozoyensis 74030]|uniref:Putative Ubiquitin carboxyl-terminal hydrolase 11 n=1 Tax=Glarea lozoyensis (strain ATCC 74030 / MF5533) TaxID=1104152 RepID=H0EWD0_GLAL7|nr:putative Ubiquitin carboxyl-terminal hydrolase 11 [Glarea lozoyensis 74030]
MTGSRPKPFVRNVKEENLTEEEVDARDEQESSLTDFEAAQLSMARLRRYMNSFVMLNMFPQMMYKLSGALEKHHNTISFPENGIDMSDYFINSQGETRDTLLGHRSHPIYDCYAVIQHVGRRTDAGHYYTYARSLDKSPKDGRGPGAWHKYDDKNVTPAKFSQIQDILVRHVEFAFMGFILGARFGFKAW